jgi:hypothetical protein
MISLLQHSKSELRAAGAFDPNVEEDGEIGPVTIAIIEVFDAYTAHASWQERKRIVEAVNRLVDYMPLTPLTGEDEEWYVPAGAGGQIMANKRCTNVFKDDEMAWDVRKGRVPLTFPYMPAIIPPHEDVRAGEGQATPKPKE